MTAFIEAACLASCICMTTPAPARVTVERRLTPQMGVGHDQDDQE